MGTGSWPFMFDDHLVIVEAPESLSLEEVRLVVLPLEGTVDVIAQATPHGHFAGIVQLHLLVVLVESGGKMKDRLSSCDQ